MSGVLARRLAPAWFAPDHQPDPAAKVEFLLKPITLPALMDLRSSWGPTGPKGEGYRLLTDLVADWRNLTIDGQAVPFSRDDLDVLIEAPTADFIAWGIQILAEAVGRARVSEDARKNS